MKRERYPYRTPDYRPTPGEINRRRSRLIRFRLRRSVAHFELAMTIVVAVAIFGWVGVFISRDDARLGALIAADKYNVCKQERQHDYIERRELETRIRGLEGELRGSEGYRRHAERLLAMTQIDLQEALSAISRRLMRPDLVRVLLKERASQ